MMDVVRAIIDRREQGQPLCFADQQRMGWRNRDGYSCAVWQGAAHRGSRDRGIQHGMTFEMAIRAVHARQRLAGRPSIKWCVLAHQTVYTVRHRAGPVRQATDSSRSGAEHGPTATIAHMMVNPCIPLSVLCLGMLLSLPRTEQAASTAAVTPPEPVWPAPPQQAWSATSAPQLQDLSEQHGRRRQLQWDALAPDEDGMASLQARSTDSLAGMSWILPRGIQALHLREGQAEFIEEPGHWRVVAGDVQRLAVHWQQPLAPMPPLN